MRFGEWEPTVSVDEVVGTNDGMHQVQAIGTDVYWLANIAAENNRGTILRWREGAVSDLTPQANVRTRVNEYGGGTYDVDDHGLAFADDLTATLYYAQHGEAPRPITTGNATVRYAGLRLATDQGLLFAVREDHRKAGEPLTELVSLSLAGVNPGGGSVVATGADFYGRPAYHESNLAWPQWNHPNMPWDSCEIWRSWPDGKTTRIAGGDGVSAVHPRFLADGRLSWLDDRNGFWNLCLDDGTHIADNHDYCSPIWTLEDAPYAQLDDDTVIATRFVDGCGDLVRLGLNHRTIAPMALGTGEVESIACSAGVIYLVALSPLRPPSLARIDKNGLVVLAGARATVNPIGPNVVWFDGPAGPIHGLLYSPVHPSTSPRPLILRCHGGPTGMARAVFDLETQFWVGRGIGVLDLNYSGSSGFGREYRERLRGKWGVLDVADCVAAVRALIADGTVDPRQVAIMGGSAGGYTALRALVSTDVFTAGISRYGIGDLESLTKDTHKFESHYIEGLVGPYPDERQLYLDRSPINQVENLTTPMLLLQGREDFVVPLNQAETMAAAAREKGVPIALEIFEGEGHGFRMVENRRRALVTQLSFLAQVWGFTPYEKDLPHLEIENLG